MENSKIPINFWGLRDNIEKLFFTDFIKPLITGCHIKYDFNGIEILIFPTVIGKFGKNGYWYGEIEYFIQTVPNKMLEKIIHYIFEELNQKYKNVQITDKETLKIISYNLYKDYNEIMTSSPIA